MLEGIKRILGLSKPESKMVTEFEVGVLNGKLVIKFNQPVLKIELDRIQTLNLIQALTGNIILVNKV